MLGPILLPDNQNTGAMSIESVAELTKALEAGYGTDVAQLSGAGALRVQSLEQTLLTVIAENKHFRLFNTLAKQKCTATVHEWTEQSGVGGFLGGSTNTELGIIPEAQGIYNRRTGLVKYLMTRRQVSFVASLQQAIADIESVEYANGAIQLLQDAEFLCFEGDSSVVPTEFDGIAAQIESLNSAEHIIDARGASLDSFTPLADAAATVSRYGNFGTPTHLFHSQFTQADLDKSLDPAFRVSLTDNPNALLLGAPVAGIRTSWGNISTNPDVFIRDETEQVPFEIIAPGVAATNLFAPTSVTAVAGAGGADSRWEALHGGNYFYAVAGQNAAGQSTIVKTTQVAVSAGQQVTLTIVPSATVAEFGYVIYRGRKNGTNATLDLRYMRRIPRAVSGNTTFVDINRDLPGSTKAYVLNMTTSAKAITWMQMLPMLKFALYPTNQAVIPWAQLLFGFLRIGKRRHHVIIKNLVTGGQPWKPFA